MDWSFALARMAPMAHPLVFRIAPLAQLPEGQTSWTALRALQGPSTGFSLRLFSAAETEPANLLPCPGTVSWTPAAAAPCAA